MKLTIVLFLSLTAFSAYGQLTVNAPAVTLDAIGSVAVRAFMSQQGTSLAPTFVISPVAIGDVSITVSNPAGIQVNDFMAIGLEHVQVTAKPGGGVLTVTRGMNGSAPAAYISGSAIQVMLYKTPNALAKIMITDAFKQLVLRFSNLQANVDAAIVTRDAAIAVAVQ